MCDDLVVSATLPLCQPPRRSERALIVKPRPFRCCGQAFCLSTDGRRGPQAPPGRPDGVRAILRCFSP